MKKIGVGLAFLITLALIGSFGGSILATSNSTQEESDFQRTLTVTGTGIVNAVPNVVRIRLGTQVTNSSLATALNKMERRMGRIIETAEEFRIPKKHRRTIQFDVSLQRDREGDLVGYQVIHMLEVAIQTDQEGLEPVGAFLDQAIAAGANRVTGVIFAIGDRKTSLKEKARKKAVQNARAKAKQLSRAAGVALGPPLTIERAREKVEPAGKVRALGKGDSVPIQRGQLQIEVRISIVYSLS